MRPLPMSTLNSEAFPLLTGPKYCCVCADPFLNDQNYILSVLSLEELGATGNKVLNSDLYLTSGPPAMLMFCAAQVSVCFTHVMQYPCKWPGVLNSLHMQLF